jgi:ribosomal protein S18 acetylase RimI-like enzyme
MKKAEKIGLCLLISGVLLTSVGLYAHGNQPCSVKSSKPMIFSPVEDVQRAEPCVEQHPVADSNVRKTEEGLVALQKTHLKTFQGNEIIPYTDTLARLSNTIYKEYPYLYGVEDTAEFYLTKFCHSSEAKLCLLFDDQTIVGYAIGVPLKAYRSSFNTPLSTPTLDREKFFYLGEIALLPRYRKQGLGKQMLSEMENMVKKDNKYPNMCLVTIDESTLLDKKPADYISLVTFWSYMGYKCCPEISFTAEWENTGETTPSSHTCIYWIKSL